MWDPDQYGRFATERDRPFHDLLGRVRAEDPGYVVDLGCATGALTATLLDRWPGATVTGVDSSAAMLERSDKYADPPGLTFTLADIADWSPERPVDVLVSNAALQWVPGHLDLLETFVAALAPGGTLAFQVPGNFHAPSHTLLGELCRSNRWRDRLGHLVDTGPSSWEPAVYLERLAGLGAVPDVWETTYHYVLGGTDPVLEWLSGTALRPVYAALDAAETERFRTEFGALLRDAYPAGPHGTVLPYRRIFAIGRRN